MTRYRILLFDADNTLFDFDRCEEEAFRRTAQRKGLPGGKDLYERYSAINAALWKQYERGKIGLEFLKVERFRLLLRSLGMEDGEELNGKAAGLRDLYTKELSEQAFLISGAEEVCRELSRDFDLYIVTNGISRIQRNRFAKSGLAPFFRGMFVSEEIGAKKPDKRYFDAVFERLGDVKKSEVLMIGDSLTSDADGAIGYGLDFCRYNPEGKPDEGRAVTYTVKKLSEIKDILNGGAS